MSDNEALHKRLLSHWGQAIGAVSGVAHLGYLVAFALLMTARRRGKSV